MSRPSYYELLRRPEWQRKRLKIMERENFTCQECGAKDKTLNVHHRYYRKGAMPWDYEDEVLQCLCEACHEARHEIMDKITRDLSRLSTQQLHEFYNEMDLEPLAGFEDEEDDYEPDDDDDPDDTDDDDRAYLDQERYGVHYDVHHKDTADGGMWDFHRLRPALDILPPSAQFVISRTVVNVLGKSVTVLYTWNEVRGVWDMTSQFRDELEKEKKLDAPF
jgi:hypothetical protein